MFYKQLNCIIELLYFYLTWSAENYISIFNRWKIASCDGEAEGNKNDITGKMPSNT